LLLANDSIHWALDNLGDLLVRDGLHNCFRNSNGHVVRGVNVDLHRNSHVNLALRDDFVWLRYWHLVWLRNFDGNCNGSLHIPDNRYSHGYRLVDSTGLHLNLRNSHIASHSDDLFDGHRYTNPVSNLDGNIDSLHLGDSVWNWHRDLHSRGFHNIVWSGNWNAHSIRFGNLNDNFLGHGDFDLLSGHHFVGHRHCLRDNHVVRHYLGHSDSSDNVVRLWHLDGNWNLHLVRLGNSDGLALDDVILDRDGNWNVHVH